LSLHLSRRYAGAIGLIASWDNPAYHLNQDGDQTLKAIKSGVHIFTPASLAAALPTSA
jgi:hypothetical protein